MLSLDSALAALDPFQIQRLESKDFSSALLKVRSIDLDPALPVVLPLYSSRARPATDPRLLLRSLILMFHFGETSIQRWHDQLECDSLLRTLYGFFFAFPCGWYVL